MIDEEARIGGVWLNFKHYSGLDLYSDGKIEDEILNIVQRNAPEDYPVVIENRESWPVLYHLSPLRETLLSWIPFRKGEKILELGSGCGAVTAIRFSVAAPSLSAMKRLLLRSWIISKGSCPCWAFAMARSLSHNILEVR